MARFALNQPIDTLEPSITVDPTLTIGLHRFQLVVTDATGSRSQPALATVEVRRATTDGDVTDPLRDPRNPVVGPVRDPIPVLRDPVIDPIREPVVNPLRGGIVAPPIAPQPATPRAATRTRPAKKVTPVPPGNRKTRKPT